MHLNMESGHSDLELLPSNGDILMSIDRIDPLSKNTQLILDTSPKSVCLWHMTAVNRYVNRLENCPVCQYHWSVFTDFWATVMQGW
jgi:hypothetical protein